MDVSIRLFLLDRSNPDPYGRHLNFKAAFDPKKKRVDFKGSIDYTKILTSGKIKYEMRNGNIRTIIVRMIPPIMVLPSGTMVSLEWSHTDKCFYILADITPEHIKEAIRREFNIRTSDSTENESGWAETHLHFHEEETLGRSD